MLLCFVHLSEMRCKRLPARAFFCFLLHIGSRAIVLASFLCILQHCLPSLATIPLFENSRSLFAPSFFSSPCSNSPLRYDLTRFLA